MSMSRSSAVYLIRVAGVDWPEEVLRALGETELEPRPLDAGELTRELPEGGGWLLLPPDTPAVLLGDLLVELSGVGDPWGVLRANEVGEGFEFVPLSAGYPVSLEEGTARVGSEGLESGYLSLRHVLADLSRLRHDANNALTSALAEAQFMRMDSEEGSELREGLTLVEQQLKRLRDLVGELAGLRVSSR